MLKFKKDGVVKAVLKDEASEPEGIIYIEDDKLPEGIQIPEDAAEVDSTTDEVVASTVEDKDAV